MLALTVLATCLQKKYEISPYGDDHREILSLWTVIVLASGERKSAVIRAMTFVLIEWEKLKAEEMEPEIRRRDREITIYIKTCERLIKDIAKETDENPGYRRRRA